MNPFLHSGYPDAAALQLIPHRELPEAACSEAPTSVQASTILHAWSEIPGLIPEADIIEVFKDKGRRLKGVNKQGTSKDTESIVLDSGSEDED